MVIEYENDDLIVVNKPAGLPVYSAKKHEGEESVVSWFLKKYPEAKGVGEPERPGVVHRLDKQTSGLLILAKTPAGFEYQKKLFASRMIAKEYLALVYGELQPRHGVVDKRLSKIGFEGQSRVRIEEKGKQAVTEYWVVKYYNSPKLPLKVSGGAEGELLVDTFTLVRVRLHTGRTHQIRVHFAHLKHPVVGDNLYGKPQSLLLKDILSRQFLHASRLEFKLPDGTWLEIESELPEELQKVLDGLQVSN